MDQSERSRLRALCEAATPGPECTGVSARWCPRCGDCTCPGDPDRGDPMDDPRCPLHARASAHGEDEEHGPDTAALLRLGDTSRTALPALLDALDAAERERDGAVAMLREILARVHRDGGQHSDAVGLAQATREADEIIARLFAVHPWPEWARKFQVERDEARAEAERLRASEASRRELMPAALDAVRKVAREEEREACAAIATPYAARWPCASDIVAKIRARGAGGER